MEINSLIFDEFKKSGVTLQAGRRVWNIADSKLWYITPKQSKDFLNFSNAKEYEHSIAQKEVSIILKNMTDIVSNISSKYINIVDIGCGNGKKSSLIIDKLVSFKDVRYCPVDISPYMLSKALEIIKMQTSVEVVESKEANIADFFNLKKSFNFFRKREYQSHVLLFLGNTFGNFENVEILLNRIKENMSDDDVLLVGNGLINNRDDWKSSYNDPKVKTWLFQIPYQVGILAKDISYKVDFKNSRIENSFILKNDKTVTHRGQEIVFKKDDILLTAISYKYTKNKFNQLLKSVFSEVTLYSDDEETYGLALCKK